jgi:hypothetical protein
VSETTERVSHGAHITRLRIQPSPKATDLLYLYLNGELMVTFVNTMAGSKYLNSQLPPHLQQSGAGAPYVNCGKGGSIEQPKE